MKSIFLPVDIGVPITQVYGAVGQTNFYNIHYGIDYGANCGSPIYCCDNGVVVFAGWASGYGNLVKVQHEWGYSLYGHQSEILVTNGQVLNCGHILGRVGTTGMSTGCHLHFECRDTSDRVFDQTQYITSEINEVVFMKLTFDQVRKWYLAILRREPDGNQNNVYVGAEMTETALAYELSESKEHTDYYDDAIRWRSFSDNSKYEKVTEDLYRIIK